MKKVFAGIFVVMAGIAMFSSNAQACTVMPVDPVAQKNDLVARALTKLNVSIEDVTKVEVDDYKGSYIWTPMCPKGLNSSAEFTISFNEGESLLNHGCTAVVKVAKHHIYKNGMPNYDIEVAQPAICLE